MSFHSNGFQDRPVMTTSVTLRICELPIGRSRRYEIVLDFLLDAVGNRNRRNLKSAAFMRLSGLGRSFQAHGFQDRPVMTAEGSLRIRADYTRSAGQMQGNSQLFPPVSRTGPRRTVTGADTGFRAFR